MLVSVCRAMTSAPGTTALCGSTTRPLTVAELTVSCANAGILRQMQQHTLANMARTTYSPRPSKGSRYYINRKTTTKDDVDLRAGRRSSRGRDGVDESGDLVIW